jgi:hypothetical protein
MSITFGGKVKAGGKLSFGSSTPATGQSGCGAGLSGANIYNQATCGNVAPFPAAPSTPTDISAFPATLGAGGNYRLTADCTLGGSNTCITSNNSNTVIDFNGHTVSGRVICQFNCDGQEWYSSVAGAQLTCATTGGNNACANIVDSGHTNPTFKFHHITLSNTANVASSSAFAFWLDWSGTTGPLTVSIYNVTASMTQSGDVSTTRTGNFRVQGQANIITNFYNNDVTCGATTPVCQGLELFDAGGNIYSNYFHWSTNTSGTDTPRAIIADGTFGTNPPQTTNVYQNYIDVANGRAFRPKNQFGARFHDNYVTNISNDGTIGALHIADPDAGDNVGMNMLAENNNFQVSTGAVAMARSGTGIILQTNKVGCIGGSCTGGVFAYARTPTGSVTRVVVKNNSSVSGVGFTSENKVDASAVLLNCNSGAVTGAGTSTSIACQGDGII